MTWDDPRVLHVVVGPAEHGVVRHGLAVAQASGHRVLRLPSPIRTDPANLDPADLDPADLDAVDVVHLPFTDRLFAERCEDAADAFAALVAPVRERGVSVSVTLHDLPADDGPLDTRRRAAYERVVGLVDGVVVNSRRELELADRLAERARSRRMIPLPVARVEAPSVRPSPRWASGADAVVLGFLFPDRGYEAVLAALPDGVDLLALGRPSAGHEDLPARWERLATEGGHRFRTSGFVPDAGLAAELWAAGVPVAPNRRVAASGSIGTWVGHGRKPLVPASPYGRELAERWPGTVTLYDADDPAALARAVRGALAYPASTWLEPGTPVGTTLDDVVAAYRRHFLGCLPPRRVRVGRDRWTVPGNRWDLLADVEPRPVSVSVVVPYHRAQAQLDLVLAGLALQDHADLEVVVADDGSPEPPSVAAAGGLPVTVVRQTRDGFRAAAARNLGARAASGEVLLFLDGDTVPAPGYVAAMARLPAACPDAVVVGRRRHADLTGWTATDVRGWLDPARGATRPPPDELTEPRWLRDGYADSADLLHAGARSHRYVISAVLGLHRDLFAEVGGFDERFRAYGGEDWELAHRLRVAGGVLAHVRTAVAWHDGPDWAGRSDVGPGAKNEETLMLAQLLPDPVARGGGGWTRPAVVVELTFGDPAAVLATARSAFAHDTDCGVWLTGYLTEAAATVTRLDDPRIRLGPVPAEVAVRAQAWVRADRPVRLLDLAALVATADTSGPLEAPGLSVAPAGARARSHRWAGGSDNEADLALRLYGGRDVVGPPTTAPVDLAHELTTVYRSVRRS